MQEFCKEYLSPILGKSPTSQTFKLPLVFVSDETYNEWQLVFNAWEEGRIIGEDGLKPGFPLKPARRDITLNDMQYVIGLRDHECKRLAKEVLDLKVYVKVTGKEVVQRDGISLENWCFRVKYEYVVRNELMCIYRGFALRKPGTGKHIEWSMDDWNSLQVEKGFNDTMISNIRADLEDSPEGKEWLKGRNHPLTPSHGPTPEFFKDIVQKYCKSDVDQSSQSNVQFDARIAQDLGEVCTALDVRGAFSFNKAQYEMFVVFGYDPAGKEMPNMRQQHVITVAERIHREVEEEVILDGEVDTIKVNKLVTPSLWLLDAECNYTLQGVSRLTSNSWTVHTMHYFPDSSAGFQRSSLIDSRPKVHVSVMYPRTTPGDAWNTFSDFTGLKRPLPPYVDEGEDHLGEDWSNGHCHASFSFLQSLLEKAMQIEDVRVINCWGGGNVTALALVSYCSLFWCLRCLLTDRRLAADAD